FQGVNQLAKDRRADIFRNTSYCGACGFLKLWCATRLPWQIAGSIDLRPGASESSEDGGVSIGVRIGSVSCIVKPRWAGSSADILFSIIFDCFRIRDEYFGEKCFAGYVLCRSTMLLALTLSNLKSRSKSIVSR